MSRPLLERELRAIREGHLHHAGMSDPWGDCNICDLIATIDEARRTTSGAHDTKHIEVDGFDHATKKRVRTCLVYGCTFQMVEV